MRKPFEIELARLDAELKRHEVELASEQIQFTNRAAQLIASGAFPRKDAQEVAGGTNTSLAALAVTEARKRRDEFARKAPLVPVAYAVTEGRAQNAHLHQRGDPEKPGPEVPRRWLEIFGGEGSRPRTAAVAANSPGG